MQKNAYFLAKIGADTAENEQHFAEILPIGRRVAEARACPRAGTRPRPVRPPRGSGPRTARFFLILVDQIYCQN